MISGNELLVYKRNYALMNLICEMLHHYIKLIDILLYKLKKPFCQSGWQSDLFAKKDKYTIFDSK
jgi:hypothetical protein